MSKRPKPVATAEETLQKRSCLRSYKNKQSPASSRQQEIGDNYQHFEPRNEITAVEDNTEEHLTLTSGIIDVPSRDWQIGHTLNQCLMDVYDNERWTDMVIRCGKNGNSRPLKAHKVILAARSPVFEAMLFGPCSGPKEEYIFPDADVEIFDMMLRYMYYDTHGDLCECDVDQTISLIQLAHMYQFPFLEEECTSHLLTSAMTSTELCQVLEFALKYDLTSLRDHC